MRPLDLRPDADLAANKPHGTRIRYMGGCKCVPCRAANSRYESGRLEARRNGDWNGLVDAGRARRHLRRLSRAGIGRLSVAEACDVGKTSIAEIKNGIKKRIRARTERRILAVDKGAISGGQIVPAVGTWKRISRLLEEGFSKAELARRLGYRRPALQLHPERITARNRMKVQRLYNRIMEIV